ncbi:MAG: ABC transporter permease subunit [Clostridium sp.]|uniref:ABC transporter permease n=1 Tax=Clostridium sp. TaxID=1506 RepID=UPI00304EE8DF
MLRLVKAELYKLFKNKTFKVLCGVAIFLSALWIVLASPLLEQITMDSMGDMSIEEKEAMVSQLTSLSAGEDVFIPGQMGVKLNAKDPMNPTALEVYHSSFGSGLIEILIGVLIGAFMAKEYTEGTIKNTLAYGKKRYEFYIAKFLALVVGIVILEVCLTLIGTVGTTIINGWGQTFEIAQLVGMAESFVAGVIANSAVAAVLMIIAILVKGNGATIGITVAIFILLPSITGFLYGVYPWFDNLYELTPFYNSALATSIYSSGGDIMKSIVVALGTIAISLLAGIQILKAQDIK